MSILNRPKLTLNRKPHLEPVAPLPKAASTAATPPLQAQPVDEWTKRERWLQMQIKHHGLAIVVGSSKKKEPHLKDWAQKKGLIIDCARPNRWSCKHSMKETGLSMAEILELYKQDLHNDSDLMTLLPTLKGKVLVCVCNSHQYCHARYLAELVNRPSQNV